MKYFTDPALWARTFWYVFLGSFPVSLFIIGRFVLAPSKESWGVFVLCSWFLSVFFLCAVSTLRSIIVATQPAYRQKSRNPLRWLIPFIFLVAFVWLTVWLGSYVADEETLKIAVIVYIGLGSFLLFFMGDFIRAFIIKPVDRAAQEEADEAYIEEMAQIAAAADAEVEKGRAEAQAKQDELEVPCLERLRSLSERLGKLGVCTISEQRESRGLNINNKRVEIFYTTFWWERFTAPHVRDEPWAKGWFPVTNTKVLDEIEASVTLLEAGLASLAKERGILLEELQGVAEVLAQGEPSSTSTSA